MVAMIMNAYFFVRKQKVKHIFLIVKYKQCSK